jgi:hypothetical protein
MEKCLCAMLGKKSVNHIYELSSKHVSLLNMDNMIFCLVSDFSVVIKMFILDKNYIFHYLWLMRANRLTYGNKTKHRALAMVVEQKMLSDL